MKESNFKGKGLRFVWGAAPWIFVICLGVFVGIMFFRAGEEKARLEEAKKAAMKKEIPPVKVITLTLQPLRVEDRINLPAEVEAAEEVVVKAELSGQVVRILAEEGRKVTKGEVLMELDDRDYRSRLDRIRANYRLAKLEYERNAALAESHATSKSKLDSIEAQLKDLKAQLEEATVALSRARIKAPISCRLNELKVEKGDFVAIGDPVAQILRIDRVKVTVGVPESDVAAIFDLQEADVIIEALEDLKVKGKKVFLASKPRSLARLYDLELEVSNPEKRILPGMFARVELVRKVIDHALILPLYSVITQGEERFVFVDNNGRAEKRPVALGVLADWEVQITSGLSPGDRVIVVGHRQVEDGQALEIIKNVRDPREILKP